MKPSDYRKVRWKIKEYLVFKTMNYSYLLLIDKKILVFIINYKKKQANGNFKSCPRDLNATKLICSQ